MGKDKKDKEKGKDKAKESGIGNGLIAGLENKDILKTIEEKAKTDEIAAGDYFVDTNIGRIRCRKSAETGRISWQLNDKQITRPNLQKALKAGPVDDDKDKEETDKADKGEKADKKGKKDKKDKKAKGGEETDNGKAADGPDKKTVEAIYKKKQIINVLKEGQLFKKKIIKGIEAAITEKKISGSAFIAILDDVTGKEADIEKVNTIFAALAA